MATYHDIRELTGLSLATISKYFNGRTVLEENRRSIEAAVTALGFRPNELARGLRSRRTRTVGVLLPALDNDFHLHIVAGVERALRSHGISLMVRSSGWDYHDPDAAEAVDFLASKMVDGLIVIPTPSDVEPLRRLTHVPLVLVDRLADGIAADAVILDNRQAGAEAATLLLDHGHSEIAIIGGDARVWTMPIRLAGFLDTLKNRGATIPAEWISQNPLTVRDGVEAMRRLLRLKRRPTAVFSANYELTVGATIALNDSGLRLPEDISFIGFDSLELSQVAKPRVTLIAQPTEAIATKAAELMLDRLNQSAPPTPPRVITLPSQLVMGASVSSPSSLRARRRVS